MASQSHAAAPEPATAVVEKTSKAGDAVTLEQVKAVAQAVMVVGGFDRFQQSLGMIREVGGLRFKDLLEAMSATEAGK